jgi:hypothetical protein
MAALTVPELRSLSAISSSIRLRTGSPSTSNAFTRPTLSAVTYISESFYKLVPDGMLVVSIPARVVGEASGSALRWVQTNPETYRELARRHAAGVIPVDSGSQDAR